MNWKKERQKENKNRRQVRSTKIYTGYEFQLIMFYYGWKEV